MKVPQLVRAGLVTGVIDAVFSSVLVRFFYGSTVTRLWQGVASVPLGPEAFNSGNRTAFVGLAIHFAVAFAWATVFLILLRLGPVRRAVSSAGGLLGVAAMFGPIVWITMSMLVIPSMTHRPPTINFRWWVQLFGHIPFVALPIVATLAKHDVDHRH